MTSLLQQNQLLLNYPIDDIKEVIRKICSLDKYMLKESNEFTNSYTILMYEGHNAVVIENHLIKIDEIKTDCIVKIYNTISGDLSAKDITRLQNIYVNLLNNLLEGKVMIKKRQSEDYYENGTSTKRFLITILIFIIAVFLVLKLLNVF